MSGFHLQDLMKSAAERMAYDLKQRFVKHPGELGTAREQIFRDFLSSNLPKRFEVSTGFGFDCSGTISKQLDIVIFDGSICPRFEVPGGKRLFPCEAVVAVGQVRSSVTSRRHFRDAISNLISVKALDRSANRTAVDSCSKEVLCPTGNHLDQIFTFLAITGRAMNGETMAHLLMEEASQIPAHHRPNVVIALDRFLITYCCDHGVCPNPMDARGVAVQASENPGDALLRFYLLLGQALNVTRTASLPYWEYLSQFHNIPCEVFFSSVETPPPYLGNWSQGVK